MKLGLEQKRTLLKIARMSIENTLIQGKDIPIEVKDETLNKQCGAFVTLHLKGQLRGCIGNISSRRPLWMTVRDMAKEAAFHDPRFLPLSRDELEKVEIEISALSPLKKIDDVEEIVVGKHGLLLSHGPNQGLLLPQVATEYQWDKTEFLEHTCSKAGLPKNCWKEKGCQIYIFSATVINERELKESGL